MIGSMTYKGETDRFRFESLILSHNHCLRLSSSYYNVCLLHIEHERTSAFRLRTSRYSTHSAGSPGRGRRKCPRLLWRVSVGVGLCQLAPAVFATGLLPPGCHVARHPGCTATATATATAPVQGLSRPGAVVPRDAAGERRTTRPRADDGANGADGRGGNDTANHGSNGLEHKRWQV